MSIDKNKLINEIRNAFADAELDGGIGLSEANAIDDYKDQHYREQCREKDEKLSWNSISSSDLNEYYTALSFFDAKGMKFHLPAFMIAEINEEYRFGMAFPLTHLSDYSKSQFALLTNEQKKVVRSFLQYLLQQGDYEYESDSIKAALENYWTE
jgi:hypothetical protein